MEKYYKCIKCQKIYPFQKDTLTCKNHSPYYSYLTLIYNYRDLSIASENHTWKKYSPLLPTDSLKINFNEQRTPLVHLKNLGAQYGFSHLYVKDESKNPTGSFKDKESIITINQALPWGIKEIFVVSSGNAAVSTAAYAQKAKIKCTCYVPKNLSVGKRFLINLYGGIIKDVAGNYEKIYREAISTPFPGWNCTPGINPLKEEGIKIIGFEIWEEIGVPDVIIVPCGNGTLLFGIYKAFKELMFLGLIQKLPRLIGVQIKNASPLKIAFEQKKDYIKLSHTTHSVAEGIIAEESYSSPKVMYALADTHGEIIEVEEKEIYNSLIEIIKTESLIPEPTSAVVYSALKKLSLDKNGKIVLINTAGGMKNLKEIMQNFVNLS